MTLFRELVDVYDQNEDRAGIFDSNGLTLVPIAHNSINVQLEVSLDQTGNFLAARVLDKQEQQTVVPATSEAANRTSKPVAYPLVDKLVYVAGDFADSLTGKDKDKAELKHQLYLDGLTAWAESDDAPSEIGAVLAYIRKNTLMADLLSGSEIADDSTQGKVRKGDWLIRFIVNDVQLNRDKRVFDSWTNYYLKASNNDDSAKSAIDYVTGEKTVTTNAVEDGVSKIDNKAKLISANDETAYTYRGLFLSDEFYQLGYLTAQKAIHTLTWLVRRQAMYVSNRVFVFWGKGGADDETVDVVASLFDQYSATEQAGAGIDQSGPVKDNSTDTATTVGESYRERVFGRVVAIPDDAKVTMAAFDAATTGRMATVYYNQLDGSTFKHNVLSWGDYAQVERIYGQKNLSSITPDFKQIVRMAYQIGSNSSRFQTLSKRATLNLMTAVVNGTPIQSDIYQSSFRHVVRPTAYKDSQTNSFDSKRWWNDVYNFAALSRYWAEKEQGMSKEELTNNRSYLFGRLLAVADAMENQSVYRQRTRNAAVAERQTMAIRYFKNMTEAPETTWLRIQSALANSYSKHLTKASVDWYFSHMGEIQHLLAEDYDEQELDTPVSYEFVLGFAEEQTDLKKRQLAHAKESKNND